MLCSLSQLKENDLAQIQTLEKEIGQPILAFSCHETSPASLDADRLEKVQALEKQLGVALVAVNA
jgi:hypothetical protein